ncbi:MAG: hypothetical protein NTV52_06245 [Acidobacteria bacterium]|nr:hypothetical protein [Acidobacteriota bacterium]
MTGRGGNTYFIELGTLILRRVDFAGNISPGPGFGELGSAEGSAIAFGFNTDEFNNDEIYTASGSTIWRGPRFNQTPEAGVRNGGFGGFDGDGPNASSRLLNNPTGMIVGANGDLYIADRDNHRVRKVTCSGVISTVAGNGTAVSLGDGGLATLAGVVSPTSVAFDLAGNLYVSESGNGKIRRVSPAGTLSTFAGTGTRGFAGDGGPAVAAQLGAIQALAIDSTGNVFVADPDNRRVRRIASSGVITTYAGIGSAGSGGGGGLATEAQLNQPVGLTIDTTGHLLISDKAGHRVHRVGPHPPSVLGMGPVGFTALEGKTETLNLQFSQPNGATQ